MGVAIALAESGGRTQALNTSNRNGSTDHGLFQINSVHKALLEQYDWKDPVQNAKMALRIYRDAGSKWTPWSVYKSGSYRKFYTGSAGGSPTSGSTDSGGTSEETDTSYAEESTAPDEALANFYLGTTPVSLGFIGTSAFWQRLGLGLLAVLLIVIGITIVFRRPIAKGTTIIAKGVASATPAGKAATIAKGVM